MNKSIIITAKKLLAAALFIGIQSSLFAQQTNRITLTIDATKKGVAVSPVFYGLMTEEINHSYDGGLYAELIQNRIFKDDSTKAVHWFLTDTTQGTTMVLDNTKPINKALTTCLHITTQTKSAALANSGFWGMPATSSTTYRCSFYAMAEQPGNNPVEIRLESLDGSTVFARKTIVLSGKAWKKYKAELQTAKDVTPTKDARFVISFQKPGSYFLNLVSLFPPTYNNRPNGNRIDLMKMMVAMKPKFLRFPGGDYLEGNNTDERFAFKNTIGDISQRPGKPSRWHYRSSDGMGLLEFLEWCEDIKAEPLLAVYAGYSVDRKHTITGDSLLPYVTEALEEIEYVMGPVTSKWGAKRAADGHPKPFKLNYVEIGNEDFFDTGRTYEKRYAPFHDAIRKAYPALKLIATTKVKSRKADLIDDHFYRSPEALREMATYYDNYSRDSTPIFVGEWAAQDPKSLPITNLNSALGDAAWLIGLERNADVVKLQCYAPLFANINHKAWIWGWNLIGYNALTSFGSPSYYAQAMFASHVGDETVAATLADIPVETWQPPKRGKDSFPAKQIPAFFAGATRDMAKGVIYVKLVNSSGVAQSTEISLQTDKSVLPEAELIEITSEKSSDLNTLAEPKKIVPVVRKLSDVSKQFRVEVAPYSINVITVKVR